MSASDGSRLPNKRLRAGRAGSGDLIVTAIHRVRRRALGQRNRFAIGAAAALFTVLMISLAVVAW